MTTLQKLKLNRRSNNSGAIIPVTGGGEPNISWTVHKNMIPSGDPTSNPPLNPSVNLNINQFHYSDPAEDCLA